MEDIRKDIDSLQVKMYGPPLPRVNGSYALERYENLAGWLRAMGIRDVLLAMLLRKSSGPLFMGCENFLYVLRTFGLSGWERNQFVSKDSPNT